MSFNNPSEFKYRNITIHFNSDYSQFFEGPISNLQSDENGCIAFDYPDPYEKDHIRRVAVHPRQFFYIERGPVIK